MTDVIIVGGGIAGLAAAWELVASGRTPLVLERRARPGGVILTEHVDGFVIDAGPDALLIQKPAAIALCRELGLSDRLVPTLRPRTAFVVKHGRLVPLPEASVLGIPTKMRPFATTPLFSWGAKVRMLMETVIPRGPGGDESIGSFMRRRFGDEMVTWLAEPLLAGIHAGDVERLSMPTLFPRLVLAEQATGSVLRSLRSMQAPPAPDGAFLSLPGGIGEMVEALVARLPDGTVRCDALVSALAHEGQYRVMLASGETLEASAVMLTTPGWATAPLLEPVDGRAADICREIRSVSSATVVFAVQRARVSHPLTGSGFVVPRPERRTLMAASFVSSKWPGRAPQGFVLLRGFVGGAGDPHVLERSDEEIAEAAWEELSMRLGIQGSPTLTRVYRWAHATPQHEVGHQARIAELDARLAGLPGLFLTGSSYRGSGIPDVIADARLVGTRAAAFVEQR
ncbi:MAG: protoporphyrinogen oxidase [Vicinamibacterales bacterium]